MYKQLMIGMVVAGVLSAAPVFAEETAAVAAYDKLWSYLEFVDNDEARVLQGLELTGRLQGDAAYFSSDDQGDFDDFVWRRFRLGGKATLFHDFLIHAEADINLNESDTREMYNRLTDAYVAWSRSKALKLKVGKQSAGFTLDGATSSKKLLTLERSIVAGNLWFPTEYFAGVSGSGTVDGWAYKLGGFHPAPEMNSATSIAAGSGSPRWVVTCRRTPACGWTMCTMNPTIREMSARKN